MHFFCVIISYSASYQTFTFIQNLPSQIFTDFSQIFIFLFWRWNSVGSSIIPANYFYWVKGSCHILLIVINRYLHKPITYIFCIYIILFYTTIYSFVLFLKPIFYFASSCRFGKNNHMDYLVARNYRQLRLNIVGLRQWEFILRTIRLI